MIDWQPLMQTNSDPLVYLNDFGPSPTPRSSDCHENKMSYQLEKAIQSDKTAHKPKLIHNFVSKLLVGKGERATD